MIPADKRASLVRVLGNASRAETNSAAGARRAELERWLGYIEQAAAEGRVYDRGLDECRRLVIRDYADLDARLKSALERARVARAAANAAREAERAQREQQWAAERHQRDVEMAQRRAMRRLYPLSVLPPVGAVLRSASQVLTVEGHGKSFVIDEGAPSVHGSHLLGHEGSRGAYAYCRAATAEEIAALEEREAAAVAAAQVAADRRAAVVAVVDTVRQLDNLAPAGSVVPAGRVVHDTRNAYGGGETIIIADDGAVWYVQGNGADGDDWSRNNVPGGIAWRITDPALHARAASLAQMQPTGRG
ncbi:hypothetical protein ISF6_4105 [Piscinibacter sakaiensis]|uniref:Uncharacterized protein n=1 Tax=Piscinibacter sakaiensis TaxID=1547922 RepID=A0A0K8P5N4_PISS1|nr:hypothetical protein ISF6_4105 [Piscinibacter sakaiensis]